MKILPINNNPKIRAYPQYAFIDAIINNETTNADIVAKIEIENFDKFNWDYYVRNASVNISNNTVSFSRNGFDIDSQKCIYRVLNYNDEFIFNINYQQYTNRWDSVFVFIDVNNTKERIDNYPVMDFIFGRYCSGDLFFMSGENYHLITKDKIDKKEWYKVYVVNGKIEIYSSIDTLEWNLIYIVDYIHVKENNDVTIGLECCLLDNQYNKWLCNNFMQIYFNKDEPIKINYANLLQRDSKNYSINPFVKFSYFEKEMMNQLNINLIEYLIISIDNNKYIELWLNEKYISNLSAYKKYDLIHESLIFGYDLEKKQFNLMSFYNGKPIIIKADFENLIEAWNKAGNKSHQITSFEFMPDIHGYDIDIFHIYNMMSDYLLGRNSSEASSHIVKKEQGVFGIKVYSEILGEENNKSIFLRDVRIAFFLNEHKKCMAERFEYLMERGLFSEDEYTKMKNYMNNIVELSEKVLFLVIKNQMRNNRMVQGEIWKALQEIEPLEKKCYSYFTSILEKRLFNTY